MGVALLIFEELIILLTQIETILNSHPLTRVSDNDVSNLEVLAYSHFLAGDVLTSFTDHSDSHISDSQTLVKKLRQDLGKRWRQEYHHTL